MDFVAIDFETANANRGSACSVGIVKIRNNMIVDEYYSLIRPKKLIFDSSNIQIHGITPEMVRNSDDFENIWIELEMKLKGEMVAAHYASFDISVLKTALAEYNIEYPSINYVCSWVIGKAVWPDLTSYRLDTLAKKVGFQFKHHNALEDARACAMVILRASEEAGVYSFDEMSKIYKFNIGRISPDGCLSCNKNK